MQNHKSNILQDAINVLKKFQCDSSSRLVTDQEVASYTHALHEALYYSGDLLRVALIGEFKSGKSTLLNSLLGGYYSATDLLEMTGWIARYIPGKEQYCRIEYFRGESEEISLSEFLMKTSKRQYSTAELAGIKLVEIGYVNSESKLILIDCPGYGTANESNESLMMQSLNESDLLLLCIDVTILGGEKETTLINFLLKTDTPYLCICTKSDNLNSVAEKEEIVEYLVNKLHVKQDKIFFTAALNNDSSNGVSELVSYLAQNVINAKVEIKISAETAFYNRIFLSLKEKLQYIRREILEQKSNLDNFMNGVSLIAKNVSADTLAGSKELFVQKFLKEIKPGLLQEMLSASKQSKHSLNDGVMQAILQKYISDDFIKKVVEELNSFISTNITSQWVARYEELVKLNAKKAENERIPMISADSSKFMWNVAESQDTTLESGVITSVGLGAALSAYAAWLGPLAPWISIGSALTVIGIPIALMGGGIAFGLSKYKETKKNESLAMQYDLFLEDYKSSFFDAVLKEHVVNTINYMNSQFSTMLKENYQREFLDHLPNESPDALLTELADCERLISNSDLKLTK